MPRHKAEFKLLGVKELDRAFRQLPKSVGKSVLRQALAYQGHGIQKVQQG